MRKQLLTGLILLLPVALTLMVLIFLFDFFTEPFIHVVTPIIQLIPVHLPLEISIFLTRLLSLALLLLFILFLGFIVQLFLVKTVIGWTHELLYRIPFIKTVYRVSKDVFSALLSSDGKKAFKRPVKMPFMCKPTYGIGFEAGEVAVECQQKLEKPMKGIFCPTAPHPISGFFFLIPEEEIQPLEMDNEEALKYLVSCGMIVPEEKIQHD
jgi:uncharacterized membrane protein